MIYLIVALTVYCSYSKDLNGQELTNWMIEDFYHLMNTDSEIDEDLTQFNRSRRENIVLP